MMARTRVQGGPASSPYTSAHESPTANGSGLETDWDALGWRRLLRADLMRKRHLERAMGELTPGFYSRGVADPVDEKLTRRDYLSLVLEPTTAAAALYRLSRAAHLRNRRVLMRLLHWASVILTGADISPLARIGPGLFIGHSVGTTVGPIRAGKNLSLLGQAVIGSYGHDNPAEDGFAVIGDNVWFFFGACSFGPNRIGSNSVLAAGAVIVRPVPEGAVVAGNPARVVRYLKPPRKTGKDESR